MEVQSANVNKTTNDSLRDIVRNWPNPSRQTVEIAEDRSLGSIKFTLHSIFQSVLSLFSFIYFMFLFVLHIVFTGTFLDVVKKEDSASSSPSELLAGESLSISDSVSEDISCNTVTDGGEGGV